MEHFWTVNVPASLIIALETKMRLIGPTTGDGRSFLTEKAVDQLGSLKISIRSREHPPPHFTVWHNGETANFDICTGEPLTGNSLRKWHKAIRAWHSENRDLLIQEWNLSRPSDCPVGAVKC